jgi:4-amino-4-deoxy-L-arabinose transferase-like glycosyltransferase
VALAAGLRLAGITWGLPSDTHLFSYHPDEYHSLRALFSLALAGDLNPHFFNYGSLYLYLVVAGALLLHPGASLTAWGEQLATGQAGPLLRSWTLDARLVSVVCSLLTVYVVFLLGRRLLGPRGGLAAALLLAVAPLATLLAHYGTVDPAQCLFLTLTLYLSLLLPERPGWRTVAWAGVCAGLAASVKYNGAVVLVAPLLAAALAPSDGTRPAVGTVLRRWGALLGAAALAFAVTSPYTWLSWSEAHRDFSFELAHMRAGEGLALAADPSGLFYHLRHLLAPGLGPALLLALLGAVGVVYRRRQQWYPLVLFALLWLVMISLARVRYPRYELALLPPLALLAAVPLSWRRGRWVWRGLAALSLLAALGWSLQTVAGLARPDPRDQALAYLLSIVPPGQSVGLLGTPWYSDPPLDYCNGGAGLNSLWLWRGYQRPVRRLWSLEGGLPVSAALPPALATSDFQVADGLRVGDPATVSLMFSVAAHYRRTETFGGAPYYLVPGDLGPDWRYPWPRLEIWQLNP